MHKNNNKYLLEEANIFKSGFDISWEIDIWGKGTYITEQYAHFAEKSKYRLLNIKVSVTAEVIYNYIKLKTAQEQLRITRKNLSLMHKIADIVKSKHTAGIADDLALNQALHTVDTTQALIPDLSTQVETYKNALAVILGTTPDKLPVNLEKYKPSFVTKTFKYSVKDLYKLPLTVIRTRPDVILTE